MSEQQKGKLRTHINKTSNTSQNKFKLFSLTSIFIYFLNAEGLIKHLCNKIQCSMLNAENFIVHSIILNYISPFFHNAYITSHNYNNYENY